MIRNINGKRLRIPGNGEASSAISPTTETLIRAMPLGANDLQTGDVARVRVTFRKGTSFSSVFRIELYWNTVASLNGSEVQLATYTCGGLELSPSMHRVFVVKSSSSIDIFNSTTSSNSALGESTSAGSTITGLNFATSGFLFVTVIRTTIGRSNDSIICSYISLEV